MASECGEPFNSLIYAKKISHFCASNDVHLRLSDHLLLREVFHA